MKRHLSIALIVAGVFVFFMAQAQAANTGAFLATPLLNPMILNRFINTTGIVSRVPPALNFRLQKVGYRDIEDIKQIEQSV